MHDAVEALGQVPHGGVTAGSHLVEDGPDLGRREGRLDRGARRRFAAMSAAATPRRSRRQGARGHDGTRGHRPIDPAKRASEAD